MISNAVKGFNKQPLHRPLEPYHLIANKTNCVDTSTDSEKSLKNYSPQPHQGPVPVSAYLITSAQTQKIASSSPDEIPSQVCIVLCDNQGHFSILLTL